MGIELDMAVIAKIWRADVSIRAGTVADIADALPAKPDLANFAVITCFVGKVQETLPDVRALVATLHKLGSQFLGLASA